jgi:hypothetical protein
MVSQYLVPNHQVYNTCSRIPKKHNVEPFLGKRSTLTYGDIDLIHYLEYLLLNRLQTNHLHNRVDVRIVDAVDVLSALPIRLSLGYLLLPGVCVRGWLLRCTRKSVHCGFDGIMTSRRWN